MRKGERKGEEKERGFYNGRAGREGGEGDGGVCVCVCASAVYLI
jgi:hypothetical protein